MKITVPAAVVICVGILASCALVFSLAVFAHWSDAAIIGLVVAAGGAGGALIVQLRSHKQTAETLTAQDRKLETIERQTNGLSDHERQDIAQRAVTTVIAQLKNEGHI